MSTTSEFAAYCVELLSTLGPVRVKRMFGGQGFYADDVFIAIAIADRLYLKTDDHNRATFEAAGCEPFVYDGGGKQVTISYWTPPDDAMESPALMRPWARLAMEAALRKRNAKPAKRAPARKTPAKPVAGKKAAAKKAPPKKPPTKAAPKKAVAAKKPAAAKRSRSA